MLGNLFAAIAMAMLEDLFPAAEAKEHEASECVAAIFPAIEEASLLQEDKASMHETKCPRSLISNSIFSWILAAISLSLAVDFHLALRYPSWFQPISFLPV